MYSGRTFVSPEQQAAEQRAANIRSMNRAAQAARNEAAAWVGDLRPGSFADTHEITEDEARLAIDMLAKMAERL